MALINYGGEFLAVICDEKLFVWRTVSPFDLCHSADTASIINAKETKLKDEDSNDETENRFISVAISKDGRHIGACSDDKGLKIWNTTNWKLTETQLIKRPTNLAFTNDGQTAIVTDKTGDVYSHTIATNVLNPSPVIGHLSMVLDVPLCHTNMRAEMVNMRLEILPQSALRITPDDKYVVTSDRDEKIRISHYPNGYNVEHFCLGHTNFVSRIGVAGDCDPYLIVSGSGDGTVRLWRSGVELDCQLLSVVIGNTTAKDQLVVTDLSVSKDGRFVCVIIESLVEKITTVGSPCGLSFTADHSLVLMQTNCDEPLVLYERENEGKWIEKSSQFQISKNIKEQLSKGLLQCQQRTTMEIRKRGKRMDLENITECDAHAQSIIPSVESLRSNKKSKLEEI